MAAHKRNGAQRENDLVDLAQMYCKGFSLRKMAAELGKIRKYSLSHVQIKDDVTEILKRWREQTIRPIEEHKAEELEKVNHLEVTYWEAWERSKQQKESTATTVDAMNEKKYKASTKKEEMLGNPAFLSGIQWCINKRCEILGLNAPIQSEQVGKPRIIIQRGEFDAVVSEPSE